MINSLSTLLKPPLSPWRVDSSHGISFAARVLLLSESASGPAHVSARQCLKWKHLIIWKPFRQQVVQNQRCETDSLSLKLATTPFQWQRPALPFSLDFGSGMLHQVGQESEMKLPIIFQAIPCIFCQGGNLRQLMRENCSYDVFVWCVQAFIFKLTYSWSKWIFACYTLRTDESMRKTSEKSPLRDYLTKLCQF